MLNRGPVAVFTIFGGMDGKESLVGWIRWKEQNARKNQEQEAVIDRAIGAKLRALYDEVAREPVPDRFIELLKQLDKQDQK